MSEWFECHPKEADKIIRKSLGLEEGLVAELTLNLQDALKAKDLLLKELELANNEIGLLNKAIKAMSYRIDELKKDNSKKQDTVRNALKERDNANQSKLIIKVFMLAITTAFLVLSYSS